MQATKRKRKKRRKYKIEITKIEGKAERETQNIKGKERIKKGKKANKRLKTGKI